MESKFPVYPIDGLCAFAPTGEQYITFTVAGVKEEGETDKGIKNSPESAVDGYINEMLFFIKYSAPKKGILYWRKRPQLISDDTHYNVYSRFLISDKPLDKITKKKLRLYLTKEIESYDE